MVRTRADCSGIRVGQKASFKAPPIPGGSSSGKSRRIGSGNRYYPREVPAWQKEITHFFNPNQNELKAERGESSTSSNVSE